MSGISVGTQLVAVKGFLNLAAGTVYHFLRSSPTTLRVLLVQFVERAARAAKHKSKKRPTKTVVPEPVPVLISIPRSDFERAVSTGEVVPAAHQASLPPWLASQEGLNVDLLDVARRKFKKSHCERVDDKLDVIHPLVQRLEEVLDSPDPELEMNRHTRSLRPRKLHVTRVRRWLYSFVLFGRKRAALHYPVRRIGRWDRLNKPSTVKRGRPHHLGKGYGHNTTAAMLKLMEKGYRRECGLGVTMPEIYLECMRKDFGCRTRQVKVDGEEYLQIYHPKGEPFPEEATFCYHILKKLGRRRVQLDLYGKVRARSKLLPQQGSFGERTWNLMQRVEGDAFAVKELPKGYVDGQVLKPLYVVRPKDTGSRKFVGIGFSQGAERASARRMARFCQAVDKVRFCRLFGVVIKRHQWTGAGVSPADIYDRGAGMGAGAHSRTRALRPVVNEMTQSHSPQSKAIMETSNPKTRSNDEAPSFIQSELRTIELARKEIFSLLEANASTLVPECVSPDIAHLVARPTPNAIWDALDKLGRNDAIQVSFDDAVRAYLEQVPAKLSRKGVELAGRLYFTRDPAFTKARESVSGSQTINVKVYVLECCVRHIWFDWKASLLELDVRYPIPVKTIVLYMSLEEAVQYYKASRRTHPKNKSHRRAAKLASRLDYERQTGRNWRASKRVHGRPSRGPAAKREGQEARHVTTGKRRS